MLAHPNWENIFTAYDPKLTETPDLFLNTGTFGVWMPLVYFLDKKRVLLICGSLENTSIVALCARMHLFTSLKCLCVALATVPTISPPLCQASRP